jgi:hypothetical protein
MSDTSPRLGLPYLQPSQAQKHVTHNEALRALDVLVQLVVRSLEAADPPAAPASGDAYALAAAPIGAWAGQGGRLAVWDGTAWQFIAPQEGWRAWDLQSSAAHVFSAGVWHPETPGLDNLDGIGIGANADAVNRLVVASEATLLTHAGGSHQLKVNKEGTADTASVVFQSGYSGRAEMGLSGDDAFSIKTRAASGNWAEALRLDPGAVSVTMATGGGAEIRLTQEGLALNMAPGGVEDWRDVYNQGNVLGAVSQVAGLATGALIEKGSNANGDYVKFADGTLICTISDFDLAYLNSSTLRADWTYPHAFASEGRVMSFVLQRRAGVAPVTNYKTGICFDDTSGVDAAMTGRIAIISNGAFSDNGPLSVRATAIGRWF